MLSATFAATPGFAEAAFAQAGVRYWRYWRSDRPMELRRYDWLIFVLGAAVITTAIAFYSV